MKRRTHKADPKEPQAPIPLDVLGTGPVQVPGSPPNQGETTAIPTLGKDAHLGAIAFLAVLAYPGRTDWEWEQRDAFVQAAKVLLLKAAIKKGYPRKGILPQYRSFKPEKMDGLLHKGFRRILHRRVPAGMAAGWLTLHGVAFGPLRIPSKEILGGIPVGSMTIRAPNNVSRAMRAILRMLEKRDGTSLEPESALANLHHRVWAETLPVLHLASVVAYKVNELAAEGKEKQLLFEPFWVPSAVFHAEALRVGILPAKIPSFEANRAVQLVPAEGWDTLLSSLKPSVAPKGS